MTDAVTPSGFLSGVRVLHTGDGLAGSAAAALLAFLGADVARPPTTGEHRAGPLIDTRRGPAAAVELVLDRDKHVLDAGTKPDLRDYDIVIADGCAPEPVAGVVLVLISPFGADGPNSNRPGGEIVAQASGGLLATIEDSDGKPVPAPGYVASKAVGAVCGASSPARTGPAQPRGRRSGRRRCLGPGGGGIHRSVAGVRACDLPMSWPPGQRPLPCALGIVHLPRWPCPDHRSGEPPVAGIARGVRRPRLGRGPRRAAGPHRARGADQRSRHRMDRQAPEGGLCGAATGQRSAVHTG